MGRVSPALGVVVVGVVLAAAAVARAEERGQVADRSTRPSPGAAGTPWKNPYGSLFLLPGQKDGRPVVRIAARPTTRVAPVAASRVVCGTRVIPIDPQLDGAIRRAPRQDDTRHSMRSVEPPLCWPQ